MLLLTTFDDFDSSFKRSKIAGDDAEKSTLLAIFATFFRAREVVYLPKSITHADSSWEIYMSSAIEDAFHSINSHWKYGC